MHGPGLRGEGVFRFRARVKRGLERLLAEDAASALVVVHKGVVRILLEELAGEALEPEAPALGEMVELSRTADGSWARGRRSSNPDGVDAAIVTSV